MTTRKTGLEKVSKALQHAKKPDIYVISGHGNFQKEKIKLGAGQYVIYLASTGCGIMARDTPSYSKSFRDWIRNDIDMRRYLRGEPSKSTVPRSFGIMSGLDVHGPGELIADIGISLYTSGPDASPRNKLPVNLMYSPTIPSPKVGAISPYMSRKWCGMFKTGNGVLKPTVVIPYTNKFDDNSIKGLLEGRKGIFIISSCRSPEASHYAQKFQQNVRDALKNAADLYRKNKEAYTKLYHKTASELENKLIPFPTNAKGRHVFTANQLGKLVNANLAKYYKTRVKTILGRVPKTNANYTRAVKRARGSPVSASPNKKAPKKNSGNAQSK
jgi:hypothetical protein